MSQKNLRSASTRFVALKAVNLVRPLAALDRNAISSTSSTHWNEPQR